MECRFCGSTHLETVIDLGAMPPANGLLPAGAPMGAATPVPLCAVVCTECWLMQLDTAVPPESMFEDYVYFSSFSDTWLAHTHDLAAITIKRFALKPGDLVMEIASNDGYLLQNFLPHGIEVLGIEPAAAAADTARAKGITTQSRFFTEAVGRELAGSGIKPAVVFGLNVFAHVPKPHDFVAGLAALTAPDGVVIFEFPHVLSLIRHCQFDTIYHEHYSYLGLGTASFLLAKHGLEVFDVEQVPTHGGSLRLFVGHRGRRPIGTAVERVASEEQAAGLNRLETYGALGRRAEAIRADLTRLVRDARTAGKTVVGYGAAAKGITLINYCGLTQDDIALVADANMHKQGKLLPGSHIPVVTPEALIASDPDIVLILPWNIRDELIGKLTERLSRKPQFVTAIPELEIS
jgi:SAM-dependent methyltransferase